MLSFHDRSVGCCCCCYTILHISHTLRSHIYTFYPWPRFNVSLSFSMCLCVFMYFSFFCLCRLNDHQLNYFTVEFFTIRKTVATFSHAFLLSFSLNRTRLNEFFILISRSWSLLIIRDSYTKALNFPSRGRKWYWVTNNI